MMKRMRRSAVRAAASKGLRQTAKALAIGLAAAAIVFAQPVDSDARRGGFMRSFFGAAAGTLAGQAAWHAVKGQDAQAGQQPPMQQMQNGFPKGWKGNTRFTFVKAKPILKREIFYDDDETLYCRAKWNQRGDITAFPQGFATPSHEKRAYRLEWEHAVPAENFGRAFPEWREGAPQCRDSDGRYFKGRKCAETNPEFAMMEGDMHNLHPSIGAVNAIRSNLRYDQFPDGYPNTFGSCAMKIDPQGRAAEPPDNAKGRVARSSLYMEDAYPSFKLSDRQRRLFQIWDRQFPPDRKECIREQRIKKIQGNGNPFVERGCAQFTSGLDLDPAEEEGGWTPRR